MEYITELFEEVYYYTKFHWQSIFLSIICIIGIVVLILLVFIPKMNDRESSDSMWALLGSVALAMLSVSILIMGKKSGY